MSIKESFTASNAKTGLQMVPLPMYVAILQRITVMRVKIILLPHTVYCKLFEMEKFHSFYGLRNW